MDSNEISWIVLRLIYALVFLYPVPGLIKDWPGTVAVTSLLFGRWSGLFAGLSVLVMIVGALSILFGVYGRIGAAGLLFFNLGGALIHYRIAANAQQISLSSDASSADKKVAEQLAMLAVVGHSTSALKNYVLAAVAFFIMLQGTGPLSLLSL